MKETIQYTIIRTDDSEEVVKTYAGGTLIQRIKDKIGVTDVGIVNLRDGRVMLIDDAGYDTEEVTRSAKRGEIPGLSAGTQIIELKPIRARKPVNAKATALYHAICVPGTTHAIVGDVAIVLDEYFA